MITPALGRLVFGMMILVFTSGLARAERVLLDWSEQTVNEPPAFLTAPAWKISLRGEAKTKIVDAKSDPANPLPDSPLALVVSEKGYVALSLQPFFEQDPSIKGWIELDLALPEKGLIGIALISSPPDSPAPQSDSTTLYTLHFRGDDTTLVIPGVGGGGGERFTLPPRLLPGEPQKVRIAWDFEADQPFITLRLNGEPLLRRSEPVVLKIDPTVQDTNINSLIIFVYSGYLGKIVVSE